MPGDGPKEAKRDIADVMRPTKAHGPDGQLQGVPLIVRKDVPVRVETLRGQQREVEGQRMEHISLCVEMRGDPDQPVLASDYLLYKGRKLEIAYINDLMQNHEDLEIFCGERV